MKSGPPPFPCQGKRTAIASMISAMRSLFITYS
jgi:hypothetical protein